MPYISRIDSIREDAIILLQRELSDAFDTPTPSEPIARESVQTQTQTNQDTSWFEHLFALSIFIGLGYALFVAVSR
jgi:hypothetical protein